MATKWIEECPFTGEWVATKQRGDVKKRLGVYGNVAAFYGLKMLDAVVQECLDGF